MLRSKFSALALSAALAAAAPPATSAIAAENSSNPSPRTGASATAVESGFEWVTLGTLGGPMPSPERAEPANLIVRNGEAYLVDAGDGAITQYISAGAQFPWLRGVFISHLHFDHTGGLFAVIGLRAQTHNASPLTIYGPPGTSALVEGLVAAARPGTESGYGVEGEVEFPADTALSVVEIRDGDVVDLGDFTVRVVKNTHYTFDAGSELDRRYQSLSFRFDLPDRSIVYTGDTGPSDALEQLARGADILVTEMIDLDVTRRSIARRAPQMDPKDVADMTTHLSTHHLTTRQIGALASRAGVGRVVITHFAGGGAEGEDAAQRYAAEVNEIFEGPVHLARDLDRF